MVASASVAECYSTSTHTPILDYSIHRLVGVSVADCAILPWFTHKYMAGILHNVSTSVGECYSASFHTPKALSIL